MIQIKNSQIATFKLIKPSADSMKMKKCLNQIVKSLIVGGIDIAVFKKKFLFLSFNPQAPKDSNGVLKMVKKWNL